MIFPATERALRACRKLMRAVFAGNKALTRTEALIKLLLALGRECFRVEAIIVPPLASLHRYLPGLTREFYCFG